MRRGIFIVLIAIAGAIIIWGFAKFQEGRVGEQIEAFAAIEDPAERIEAVVTFVGENPGLEQEYVDAAAATVTESIGELHEDGMAASEYIDGMLAAGVPEQLIAPLLAEQHFILLVQLYYGESDGLAEQADGIARRLLARDEATAQHLVSSAHIRGAVYPALQGRWPTVFPDTRLTLELAEAGLAADGETPVWFEPILINAYRPMLGEYMLENGEGNEIDYIDQLLADAPSPAHEYALHYHRFMRLSAEDGEAAMPSAHAMAELMGDHGDETSLNTVGYSLADSGLDPELGLALCEQSLTFASSPEDSANVLDSIGWAHYKLGDYEQAETAILAAITLTPGSPALDDVMVAHLLDIYDAADNAEGAVDLLAPIVARSPNPAENGGDALMEWVARAGDTASLEVVVAQHRYGGVEDAPDFTFTGGGETVGLADCEGSIIVLNFWGAG